jgi:hypothetical protein
LELASFILVCFQTSKRHTVMVGLLEVNTTNVPVVQPVRLAG